METKESYEDRILEKAVKLLKEWRTYGVDKHNSPEPLAETITFLDAIYLGK